MLKQNNNYLKQTFLVEFKIALLRLRRLFLKQRCNFKSLTTVLIFEKKKSYLPKFRFNVKPFDLFFSFKQKDRNQYNVNLNIVTI